MCTDAFQADAYKNQLRRIDAIAWSNGFVFPDAYYVHILVFNSDKMYMHVYTSSNNWGTEISF